MSHWVQLLAGPAEVLRRLHSEDGDPVRLFVRRPGDALAVAPILLGDRENVSGWYGPIRDADGGRFLAGGDLAYGCTLSAGGALAYVETNYWGGTGHQSAALWRDGQVVFELAVSTQDPTPDAPPRPLPRTLVDRLLGRPAVTPPPAPRIPGPIDRALAGLYGDGQADGHEFTRFGLALVRDNNGFQHDWTELPPP